MEAYQQIVRRILQEGEEQADRTGVGTKSFFGIKFEHDMAQGFPLVTTKKTPFRLIASELEWFINGETDKRTLQAQGNHIWDEWCNRSLVPYGRDATTKQRMMEEPDLGPVYGFQWRHFGALYEGCEVDYAEKGIDQLRKVVEILKKNPTSRRMVVSAWNPIDLDRMALDPCHYAFQINVSNGKLDLAWNQRSVDTMLGLPFNIASYALLLHLLAKESGHQEGKLVGFLANTHIYKTHLQGAAQLLERKPFPLPKIETPEFTSIFDWKYTNTTVKNYQAHPKIEFEIAV